MQKLFEHGWCDDFYFMRENMVHQSDTSSTPHRCQGWCRVIYFPTHLLKLLQKALPVCAGHTFSLGFRNEMCLSEQYLSWKKRHLGFKRFQSRVNLDSPFCSLFHQGKDTPKHSLCFTPNTILAVINYLQSFIIFFKVSVSFGTILFSFVCVCDLY